MFYGKTWYDHTKFLGKFNLKKCWYVAASFLILNFLLIYLNKFLMIDCKKNKSSPETISENNYNAF